MFAVATDDLQQRWRTLTSEEYARATVLLADAAAFIRAECPGIDARVDSGQLDEQVVRAVACAVVRRAMIGTGAAAGPGVANFQEAVGPFSQAFTYSNPMGDLYLTRADTRRLGYAGQKAFSVDLAPAAHPDGWHWF